MTQSPPFAAPAPPAAAARPAGFTSTDALLALMVLVWGTNYIVLKAVAYLIWYRGVQRLGPSRTAFYSNVTPVVAMLTAWIALGETPTPWQVAGAGGIFGGLYLTRT